MNWRAIRAIIRKDVMVIARSKAVMLPLIIVPIMMQVIMPAGFGLMANLLPASELEGEADLGQMTAAMPPNVRAELGDLEPRQLFLVLMIVYLFAPMYLIVPLMVASVVAADSFAGEKERKTLEALLHSPISRSELLVGKILSGWLPAIGVSLLSFVLYSVVGNLVGWPLMGRIFFPNAMWFVLVLWVAPAVSGLGLSLMVIVSTRVRTFQEAYQLGGMVVLPVVLLMIGQISGLVFLSVGVALLLGLAIWAIDAVLLLIGVKTFQREKLLAQL